MRKTLFQIARNVGPVPGYRDGGPIRGPGTGTSDSIPDKMRPGSFIMPADSTQSLGAKALSSLGKKVPVRVSNGEYEYTPEQVHAVGLRALSQLKDVTHTPAQGFDPAQRLAIGGEVTNDVTRIGNSYSGGNVGGDITVNGDAPHGFVSSVSGIPSAPNAAVQALPSVMPAPGAATSTTSYPNAAQTSLSTMATPPVVAKPVDPFTARNNAVSASSITRTGAAQAVAPSLQPTTPATTALSTVAAPPAAAKPVDAFTARNNAVSASSITNNGGRFDRNAPGFADGGQVRGFFPRRMADGGGVEDQYGYLPGESIVDRVRRKLTPSGGGAPLELGAPNAMGMPTQSAGSGRGFTNPNMASPDQPAPVVPATPAAQSSPDATPTDTRLSLGTQTTPRSLASLATQAPVATPVEQQPAQTPAVQALSQVTALPSVQAQGVAAPQIHATKGSWQTENDLRNARVSASSITNDGGRWDQHKGISPARAAYAQMMATDAALQNDQAIGQQQAMAQQQANARTAMQQTGDNQRTAINAQRYDEANQIARGRLMLEQIAAGHQSRTSDRIERAQVELENAKTPEAQRSARERLLALAGKTDGDVWAHAPGGQMVDPKTQQLITVPSTIYNRRSGETRAEGGQGGAAPSKNHAAALRANPGQAALFDEIYGKGAAARILGG